jgi:hypothetical protein
LDGLHSQFSAKADIIFSSFEEAGHARNSSAASGKAAACFVMRILLSMTRGKSHSARFTTRD